MSQYVSIEEFNSLKSAYIDTVELLANAMKRITQLENALFSTDSEGELLRDETDEPIISPNLLSVPEKHIEEKIDELPIIPETSLEHKAYALVEHLKEKVKPRNNEVFLNSREIITFLKNEIPEELRIKEDIKNPRQVKKDILEKAVKLFSSSVMIIKNKSGNKVTGIALKPSAKCRYTDTC